MNRIDPAQSNITTTSGDYRYMEQDSSQPNVWLQAILGVLRHWWLIVFPTGLVLAVVAVAGIYYTFEPQFKAQSTIEIADDAPFFVFPDVRADSSDRFVNTQSELLRSAMVLGPVVSLAEIAQMPEVAELEDPASDLSRAVSFKSRGNSNLYDVSYTGPNAKNAAKIVNAVVDSYFRLREEHNAQQMSEIIEQLEHEVQAHEKKVERLMNIVRELTKDLPEVKQKSDSQTNSSSLFSSLRFRLVDQEVKQAVLRAELAAFEEIDRKNPVEAKDAEVAQALEEREEILTLQEQITQKQKRLDELKGVLVDAENDPRYKDLTGELKRDEELLAETRKDLLQEVREDLLEQRDSIRAAEIERRRANLSGMEILHGILQKRMEKEVVRTTTANLDNLDLEFKRQELVRAEFVLDLIAQRVEKLQTEQRAPRQVRRRLAAFRPSHPVEKYPLKPMALVGIVGFCLPLLLAYAWEWRMQRLSNVEQLSANSLVPVVGEIASFPSRARSNGSSTSRKTSRMLRHFEESVHNLRTYLVLSESLAGMKVLAVTSSVSQEGKTSVATQLALSFAGAGGRVLLIDGDMRSPDVHSIFDIKRDSGLAEVLDGKVSLEKAICRDWSDDLHILPAGKLSVPPHQLVSNGAVTQLLGKLQDKYTTIIIDTPPVLAASEALVMARAADATLLCTMKDTSRMVQVEATHRRLVSAGARPVGAVFSGVSVSRYHHTYGDYDYSLED